MHSWEKNLVIDTNDIYKKILFCARIRWHLCVILAAKLQTPKSTKLTFSVSWFLNCGANLSSCPNLEWLVSAGIIVPGAEIARGLDLLTPLISTECLDMRCYMKTMWYQVQLKQRIISNCVAQCMLCQTILTDIQYTIWQNVCALTLQKCKVGCRTIAIESCLAGIPLGSGEWIQIASTAICEKFMIDDLVLNTSTAIPHCYMSILCFSSR